MSLSRDKIPYSDTEEPKRGATGLLFDHLESIKMITDNYKTSIIDVKDTKKLCTPCIGRVYVS